MSLYANDAPTLEPPVTTAHAAAVPQASEGTLRKLLLGSGSRVAFLAVNTVIGLLMTPYILHSLGDRYFGLWALTSTVVGYYSILDLGLSGSLFTQMSHALGARDHISANRIYSTGLALYCWIAVLIMSVAAGCAFVIHLAWPSADAAVVPLILLTGFHVAIGFPMRAPYGVLNAGSHFDLTNAINIGAAVLRVIAMVFCLRSGYHVVGLAFAQLLAAIPGFIAVLMAVRLRYPFMTVRLKSAWHASTAKSLFHFAGPVLLGQVADRLRLQSDALVVSFALGLEAVAHYNVASTLAMYYLDGVTAVVGVLSPLLARQFGAGDHEGLRRNTLLGTRASIVCATFIGFLIVSVGPSFIQRWMGARFLDAYPVLLMLAGAIFIELTQITATSALYATKNVKVFARINVAEALANVVLSIILVRRLGMIGVALGTLIPALAVRGVGMLLAVRRCLNISPALYADSSLAALGRSAFCLVLPAALAYRFVRPDYLTIATVSAISAVLFAAPIWISEFHCIGITTSPTAFRILHRLRPTRSLTTKA
ncbi:Membrane protein involved in the export of O-antigen and teichoic acid [Terriglobus roseus]|uniref:Membrane protein involved in the export of O-antigen and teichoic acid n=2 Tax=Terriglobus roseus TaxID=392734 RepID=A0A1H4SH37_9BACT|nr:Membrane protein involved in the export of O-antigen and teichoic acid [Terriglobus roseus]